MVLGLINVFGLLLWTSTFPIPLRQYLGLDVYYPRNNDALEAALSLGRLDAISISLTILGVVFGLLALVGFGYIKNRSEQLAKDTA